MTTLAYEPIGIDPQALEDPRLLRANVAALVRMHRASQPVDELQIVKEGERDGRFSRGIERQQVRGRQGMNICLRSQIEQLANLATALTSVHPPEKRTKSANRASTRRKTDHDEDSNRFA